jgi:hypothetical protein
MKKMLKRADGSKSQRGLWDNIRAKAAANKKAGKKGKAPSEAMLEQEAKIKAEMKMGGDWMQSSKELKFGGPTKYQLAGVNETTPTPTYTKFTVTPTEPEKKEKAKLSGESRGGRIAGGGNKGGGSTAFNKACIGESCRDMMSSKGGKETNAQNQGGAKGLSMKPKIDRSRIVNQTADEKLAGLENRAKYAAEGEARMAQKKAERDARAAASAPTEVKYDFKQVYATDPADPNAKQKTGGKRKSNKK